VILVDEAYVDFGGRSAAALIDADHPNLLVVQTLSKSRSLAGLRVGFALGPQPLIAALSTVKNSFNCYPLDRVAMAAAEAAMDDEAYFQETCAKVVETRTHLVDRLTRMGFEVLPSAANFVLARPPKLSAAEYYQALKNEGVLIRYFNRPRLDGYVRISVGTDAEMEVLLDKTAKVLL
jgi:histidinol-phosphate aminotransferase